MGCVGADRPGIDLGEGRRRWRALDLGTTFAFVESDAPRVTCRRHGVVVCAVPWARHDSRFTRAFEDQVCWLAVNCSKTAVAELMRVAWRSVGAILERACAEATREIDLLDGLRRIGIDEKSWGKGSGKYLVIVTDHDNGRVAWTGEGRCQATVEAFFDDLGPERAKLLTHVSADGADWIHPVVREKAPQAEICLDAFHVVKWAGEKLDALRRRIAGELRATGRGDEAATLGAGMWALRKDQQKLTPGQRGTLAQIAVTNKPLYKGYLIKEQIREAFKVKGEQGKTLMRGVTAWAHRCRIPEFAKLAKTLTRYKVPIDATLGGGPSNGRAEALNAQVGALITRARGFRSAAALMAMIDFVHGGLCPESPYV